MENKSVKFWGKLSTLWLLLAPVCAVVYVFTTTISPHDFWWHAAAGRLLAQSGQIPTTNYFSWAMPENAPYVYQNWLCEWLIYQTLQLGGISAIAIWRSAAVGIAFALIGWAAHRRASRTLGDDADEITIARSVAIGLFLSLAMIANNLDARPQTFALPFFALLVFLLMEWPFRGAKFHWAAGAMLALLSALWANIHGSFFLAPFCFLVAFCGEAIGARIKFFSAMNGAERRSLFIAFAACLVAVACNPLGFGIFSYVAKLSTNATIQKSIREWEPPNLSEGAGIVFWISPLLLLLIARIASRKARLPIRGGEALLLLALFLMAARNMRSILWFSLLFAPLFATFAAIAFAKSTPEFRRTFASLRAQVANAFLVALLVLSVVPVLPRFKEKLAWPASFRARFAPTPRDGFFARDPELLLDRDTPVEAAEYLRAHPPRRLWNDMGFGSYLMWALPEVKLSADPRIELYSTQNWKNYLQLAAGTPDALYQLDAMQVSHVLCDPHMQGGLLKRLRVSRRWRQIPLRGTTVLMERRQPWFRSRLVRDSAAVGEFRAY